MENGIGDILVGTELPGAGDGGWIVGYDGSSARSMQVDVVLAATLSS